jgi:hypothetical protein
MAISWPAPSWSVLLRRIITRRPPSTSVMSSTRRATSSERRKAPANPISSIALSRRPVRVAGHSLIISTILAPVAGAFFVCAVPIVRRMPATAARTVRELVGDSRSAASWANRMAAMRRLIVENFAPSVAIELK